MSVQKKSCKNYWKIVKLSKKILSSSVISEISEKEDIRPHANITINGVTIRGLLDSGASISCFGLGAIALAQKLKLKIKWIKSEVKTADGAGQPIIGYVDAATTFKNQTSIVRFYLIPSLQQTAYFGIDFWNNFGLVSKLLSEIDGTSPLTPNTHQLNISQNNQLSKVVLLFPSSDRDGLGKTSVLQHSIDTKDAVPIKQRYYAVSPAVQSLMDLEIDRMISLGVVEPSHSPWSSPMVLIRKDSGKNRLCLDSRALNKVTTKDAYPLPIISGLLSRLGDTHYISSIDLKDAFWQIELDESSRAKTAFTIPGRPLYQFRRMPFGLCNAAQTMCRLMDMVMGSDLRESVFVYIDDLLIVSPDFDTHIELLKTVAQRLRSANLTINVKKSKFIMREIQYLGYIVGHGELKTDPSKVASIESFPIPKTVRQLRRFLGMTGWYQRFIRNFSAVAAPMSDLIGKKGKFEWTTEAQAAFQQLKICLTTAPVLHQPDFSRPFFIQCDASVVGVGSVLFQLTPEGEEHPIAFHSKKLSSAQRKYSVTELECLAAVLSVKHFRAYVEMMPFTIITDHASLKWLMSQKDLGGRLGRWSLKLQTYNFDIQHRKGSANVVPDALSRMFVDEIDLDRVDISLFLDLDSPEFQSVAYEKQKSVVNENPGQFPDVRISGNYLFNRLLPTSGGAVIDGTCWKLWVPESLTEVVISRAHCPSMSAHRGISKTIDLIRRNFYWPGLVRQTREFVVSCQICKEVKAPNRILRPLMGQQMIVERPWQRLYTDLLGPYPRSSAGNTHLLVVLDSFSKFVLIHPLRKAQVGPIIKFIETSVFHLFGVPETILSDNGVQYISKQFADFLKKYGVKHIRTAVYSPQVNASERVNRSILSAIRAGVSEDQKDWDESISAIGAALRNSVHDSTGFSPFFIVFGQHMAQHGTTYELSRMLGSLEDGGVEVLPKQDFRFIVNGKVKENLRFAHQEHEQTYNTRAKTVNFNVGQEVYRRVFAQSNFEKGFNAKLGKKWVKARILSKVGNSLYQLSDMNGKRLENTYHGKDLKQ